MLINVHHLLETSQRYLEHHALRLFRLIYSRENYSVMLSCEEDFRSQSLYLRFEFRPDRCYSSSIYSTGFDFGLSYSFISRISEELVAESMHINSSYDALPFIRSHVLDDLEYHMRSHHSDEMDRQYRNQSQPSPSQIRDFNAQPLPTMAEKMIIPKNVRVIRF